MDVIFPRKIVKRTLFVRCNRHWINVPSTVRLEGGGLRGYRRLIEQWASCILGKHRFVSVFRLEPTALGSSIECHFCCKKKEDRNA